MLVYALKKHVLTAASIPPLLPPSLPVSTRFQEWRFLPELFIVYPTVSSYWPPPLIGNCSWAIMDINASNEALIKKLVSHLLNAVFISSANTCLCNISDVLFPAPTHVYATFRMFYFQHQHMFMHHFGCVSSSANTTCLCTISDVLVPAPTQHVYAPFRMC